MNEKNYSLVAGLLFLVIALFHAMRLIYQWELVINGWPVPLWASVVVLIIAGGGGIKGVYLSRKHHFLGL